jgi:hypothetical protein
LINPVNLTVLAARRGLAGPGAGDGRHALDPRATQPAGDAMPPFALGEQTLHSGTALRSSMIALIALIALSREPLMGHTGLVAW